MIYLVSLLVQGVGGLFLVVVCCTLYAHRRRPYFWYWILSWFCLTMWLLLGSLKMEWTTLGLHGEKLRSLVQDIAVVAGWWHAVLWVFGMVYFHGTRAPPVKAADRSTTPGEAKPHFSRAHVLTMLMTGIGAVLASRGLSLPARDLLLACLLSVVYAWSAIIFARAYRAHREWGSLLLAIFLAVYAAEQLHHALLNRHQLLTGIKPDYVNYLRFADFLLETLTAVATIAVLLNEEEDTLRDALGRLAESEDHFRLVFENSGVGMALLAPDGCFLRVNPAVVRFFGRERVELLGRRLADFAHPDAASLEGAGSEKSQEVPTDLYERERCYLHRDGSAIWARVVRMPLLDAGGKLLFIVSVLVDITEQRRVKDEQRRLEEQLRQAQKMETLGTLVGGIAHDFNNQLTVILGNLGLVLAETVPGGKGQRELADAEKAAQRCADMTQGLLTFSRRRVGQTRPIVLNQLISDAARLFQRVLPATIRIDLQTEPQLWPVEADSTQLHQVVMNLAVNARDAMPLGGTLTLSTANRTVEAQDCKHNLEARPGRFVVLSVMDTGTGIQPEIQARIFDPFFTTKDVGQGTGLGLAVVFGIVKAHRGWITVASEPGGGSTFQVYLPTAEGKIGSLPEVAKPPAAGGKEGILVVDDEAMVRNMVGSVLERRGFRVLLAGDGEEALSVYRQRAGDIDLVLLDYTMPRQSGMQVLKMLRRLNPNLRVILSSGNRLSAENTSLVEAGVQAFVAKPYQLEELVRTVRHVLDRVSPAADRQLKALMTVEQS
jgi:PAS domain S-box-containing protein